ncbi:MAG: hypothetical protein R2752_07050 [Vicinamibacterales bacterium]
MRSSPAGVFGLLVLIAMTSGGVPAAQAPTAGLTQALDRYFRGDFDAAVADVTAARDYDGVLKGLRAEGEPWTRAGGPDEVDRRTLAAATFAMEVARAAVLTEDWKWQQRVVLDEPWAVPDAATGAHVPAARLPESFRAPDSLYWRPAPLLLEWGCALLRARPEPSANERLWQLAAVGVAELAGDFEFLLGSPWQERGNAGDEIEHLNHVIKRFPDEPRFALAQGVAMELRTWGTGYRRPRWAVQNGAPAIERFDALRKAPDIGAEASLRLGVLRFRQGGRNLEAALDRLTDVEALTRDPYLLYLARYVRGLAFDAAAAPAEAERAYRGALAVVPRAQAASIALAALLFTSNRPTEAGTLVDATLRIPQPADPWRGYQAADDRFWPELVTSLRGAVASAPAGTGRPR